MDELRRLARVPLTIFEQLLQELEGSARDPSCPPVVWPARLAERRDALARELAESVQQFRRNLGKVEPLLLALCNPPRPDLDQAIHEANQHLQRLMDKAVRREQLLRAWEDKNPEAILDAYCNALQAGGLDVVELYEAEAEAVLRRKGNAQALQGFVEIRTLAEQRRLTPEQKQAQADLDELEQLKEGVALTAQILALTLKVFGEVAGGAAGWRREIRLSVEPQRQGNILVLVMPGAAPGMTATLADVSRTGLQLELPVPVAVGTRLNLIVRDPELPKGAIRLEGEVRWCQPANRRHRAGLRIAPRVRAQWVVFLARVAAAGSLATEPTPGGSENRSGLP